MTYIKKQKDSLRQKAINTELTLCFYGVMNLRYPQSNSFPTFPLYANLKRFLNFLNFLSLHNSGRYNITHYKMDYVA